MQFLYIAKASCPEVRCHLSTALDQTYKIKTKFKNLKSLAKKLSVMIGNFIKYLKRSGIKCEKFKPQKMKTIKEELEEFLKKYVVKKKKNVYAN